VELAIKRAKGKFPVAPGFADALRGQGLVELPFTTGHAAGVEALVGQIAGDPFDWMILAQARAEGLTLITADRRLLAFANTVDASQ
jgi:PIN domain nuclease of toxin-antitoxin system